MTRTALITGASRGLGCTLADLLAARGYAIARQEMVHSAYVEAVEREYLWHEFGDSHLIVTR